VVRNVLPEVPILDAFCVSFIKCTHEAAQNGLQESVPRSGLWPVFLQLLDPPQDALPILTCTQQRDMGDAARYHDTVAEIGPQSSHHDDTCSNGIVVCRRLEIGHNPVVKGRVDHILVDETGHFLRYVADVHGTPIPGGVNNKLLLAFMRDEKRAELFSASTTIDEEIELGQDAQPDVVGTEDERMVLAMGTDDSVYETIFQGGEPSSLLGERSGLWYKLCL
jgi:hypothetical protein